ncbi:MAG: glycoside hydrolase family 52 protein [Chitinispirillia bacterium]|nr:glycoside hydrolase family 52 protein [Chitinispirillia bacterium]MCL2242040.1 glycoside hydrolase family 52 protein [Chitinispirillia bacterium]
MANIFYNSHHSPVGAFASFTLGYRGASGGFGMELSGPACQNVYIGAESDIAGEYRALPFYKEQPLDDDCRPNSQQGGRPKYAKITQFADAEIAREMTPSTDCWRAGDIEFTIYTPHPSLPDPRASEESELKRAAIPAVFAEFTLDNTKYQRPRRAFFGYEGNDPYSAMVRCDGKSGGKVKGVGQGGITGIFTGDMSVDPVLAFSIGELLAVENLGDKLPFGLGTTGLVLMTAAAGERRTWRFAVCFYRAGTATAGKPASYLYTRFFDGIRAAAQYGLDNFDWYRQAAANGDRELLSGLLSDDRRFLLSQAVKSYYGSTQLLADQHGIPLWVVVEGAYRMINTLDLAVDHLFFEMRKNPWVVRSVINQYARGYYYVDDVKDAAGRVFEGGISFTHDMGVANVFSEPGRSSYELRGLTGCYSYMTQEQLVNWILCAGVYWKGAGGGGWLTECHDMRGSRETIEECLKSMVNRDGAVDGGRDGVMDLDSDRTGDSGAEITTYDNVDRALGQARRSSYLAVKCWAAYLALEKMFGAMGMAKQAKAAAEQAGRCAGTILKYRKGDGTIPAILEDGNEALTLSLVEGLIYPYEMGMFEDPAFTGKYGDFVNALKKHFEAALAKGCKFPDGAWRMSKTSDNSWPSKTFLCQFISEKIFGHGADKAADAAHAAWLLDPDNAFFAFSDQMSAGKVCGSAYYPRGVTAILWV